MKMLGVQFSDVQMLKMKDAADTLDISNSKVARAAMRLGVQQILALAARDVDKAKELVLINDAKSKL
tara:strand:+ start:33222 stop:33422 length:201 start_codon:yes stop_codon:yes gene_type:complete